MLALAAAVGAACGLPACRPVTEAGDPVNLIWDEDALEGTTRILKVSRTDGIKVLFWNVAWSSLNAGNIFEKNLAEIITSNARPHLIVLAEFKPSAVPPEERRFLEEQYPFHDFVPYSPGNEVGIQVYSESRFKRGTNEPLDWAHIGLSEADAEVYKSLWYQAAPGEVVHWGRPYSRFTWEIAGHRLNLVPVHLLEPWVAYRARYGDESALETLFLGGDNPLTHQILNLRAKLLRDFGENLDSEPLLLVGDFNVPKKAFTVGKAGFLEVPGYKILSEGLDEVFPGSPFTFPAFSSPERQRPPFKYNFVKIDHAFVNRHFQWAGAAVLPLRGSDHYPIYFSIQGAK